MIGYLEYPIHKWKDFRGFFVILEQSLSSSYGEHNSSQSDLSFNKIFSNSKLIEGIFLESLDLFER